MKTSWIALGVLAVLAMPVTATAEGIVGGAQQGASQGARQGSQAAGPVGGVVGGAVGTATGAAKGALGIPQKKTKKKKATP